MLFFFFFNCYNIFTLGFPVFEFSVSVSKVILLCLDLGFPLLRFCYVLFLFLLFQCWGLSSSSGLWTVFE